MKTLFGSALLFANLLWAAPSVPVLTLNTSVNPGTGDYLVSRIEEAEKAKAPYVIIRMDTPGGLLTTTRQIVQKMLNSSIPIVVYVSPRGAHAGSAGALITLAADIAAMAPGTNIGAAHPVVPGDDKPDKAMAAKMANDTAAFAESVAKTRGRNKEWAVKAVKDSVSVTADDALKQGIIDVIAEDMTDLQQKLPGMKFKAPKAGATALPADPVVLVERPMNLKHRAVSFFADPNIAYLIMSLGALCIWIELSNPGMVLPGVIGVICVLISLVSFQLLPISYGALALIFVGLGFVVAELFLPTFGVLGIAGIAAFIFGSLFLMDTNTPEFQISLKLIFPTAAALAAAAIFIGVNILKAQKLKNASGLDTLLGQYGEVREPVSDSAGKIFVQGELWNAVSGTGSEIPKGAVVVVKEVRRMQLVVVPTA